MARIALTSNTTMARRDLVVIGASAGAVPVVLHVGAHHSVLPDLLKDCGALRAQHAVDGRMLQPGTIEIAPPDLHMLVEGKRIRLP